jgi:cytochrome P450
MTTRTTAPQASDELLTDLGAIFAGEPQALADPYPVYRRLREEAPVLRMGPLVVVSRYVDHVAVLRDPETFSSRRHSGGRLDALRASLDDDGRRKLADLQAHQSLWVAMLDRPEHTRVRGLANQAFTPRRVMAMREQVQAITDHLLDAADGDGSLQLVRDLSFPLPLRVITLILGASTERADDIRRWSDTIAVAIGTEYANTHEAHAALADFRAYATSLIDELRHSDRTDLFAALVAAEADGEQLTTDELVAMCVLLLFAGHETTTKLISNSVLALLRNPDQLEILRADPSLTFKAVEEFLRYDTSNQAIHRVATRDTEIGGVPVSAGETIRLMQGAANHDEAVFPDPEHLDVRRENAARHIGLGFGIHTCLGAWVARLETEIALNTLIRRYPRMRRDGDIVHSRNFLIYGPDEVPLALR